MAARTSRPRSSRGRGSFDAQAHTDQRPRNADGPRRQDRREADRTSHPAGPPDVPTLEDAIKKAAGSVAVELAQALVADPEVVGDLVQHDAPDLRAGAAPGRAP